jgi:hypothetical protein
MGLVGFGRKNPFPFRFGGGESTLDVLHEALLDHYAPAWDVDDSTEKNAEAYAQALAVTFVWIANNRMANQGQPLKMIEVLPIWEQACGLRPTRADRAVVRRRRLAARLRGVASNALSDIEDACSNLLGDNFIQIDVTPTQDEMTFWPAELPGPPGFEWCSNRLTVRVRMGKQGLTDSEFDALVGELDRLLDGIWPSWMTYSWYTSRGFHVDVSRLGEEAL